MTKRIDKCRQFRVDSRQFSRGYQICVAYCHESTVVSAIRGLDCDREVCPFVPRHQSEA